MFDTMKTAKKIRDARIGKNMTQMNLADEMGVSYQAVSNWERGNSLPDISKLTDLCRILGLRLDELLGGESRAADIAQKAIQKEPLTIKELTEAAPLLPPEDLGEAMEQTAQQEPPIDIAALLAIAPFLDDEYLDRLVERASVDTLAQISELAPFLSDKALETLLNKYDGPADAGICDLAPFLSEETLDKYVIEYLEQKDCDPYCLVDLCPFLSASTVRKIADYIMHSGNYKALSEIAPFL